MKQECEWCEQPFIMSKYTPRGLQRFCSRNCQVRAHRHDAQARKRAEETS